MTDEGNRNDTAERSRINLRDPHEVSYWTKELGVSPATLRQLARKHWSIGCKDSSGSWEVMLCRFRFEKVAWQKGAGARTAPN
jgi:hypothetical protein